MQGQVKRKIKKRRICMKGDRRGGKEDMAKEEIT